MDATSLYNSGISFDEFVNQDGDTYKEKTLEIFNNIKFDEEDILKVKNIKKEINILICAEIWCPDCMINVQVLEKMRELNDNINISIVGREGHEEIFSGQDGLRIPTFIFYDNNYNELGRFVEYPKKVKEIVTKGQQPNIIVAKRKYRKGEDAKDTLQDIISILL